MRISIDSVKALNPCESRFSNFVQHYPNFSGTVSEFLSLENITYSDKTWVLTRMMTKTQKVRWATACAWSVLEMFETKYPNNKWPRAVLEFLDTIGNFDTMTEEQLKELSKLRAAADAAAYAADAADAAAYAADAAAYAAKEHQQDLNLLLLVMVLEESENA